VNVPLVDVPLVDVCVCVRVCCLTPDPADVLCVVCRLSPLREPGERNIMQEGTSVTCSGFTYSNPALVVPGLQMSASATIISDSPTAYPNPFPALASPNLFNLDYLRTYDARTSSSDIRGVIINGGRRCDRFT
jgi:hypothetical protein